MRLGSKYTVDRLIKISDLKRKGLFFPGSHITTTWSRLGRKVSAINAFVEENGMTLSYLCEGEKIEYTVLFEWTPCNYGGERPWFTCPRCHRRTMTLYEGGKYFLCRHCLNLAYESQNESDANRIMRKAQKIRERLGGSGSMAEPFPPKPKGMHWKTYFRLKNQADRYEGRSWGIMAKRLNLNVVGL